MGAEYEQMIQHSLLNISRLKEAVLHTSTQCRFNTRATL
jgi:hypothetical protein